MGKAMTDEIREASAGNYLTADDFLNRKVKLRLTATELKKDEVESQETGEKYDKVIFYFETNKGEEKEIGVLAFDSLVRQMNAVDPEIGDILELESFQLGNSKYLNWKVEIVRKATKKESKKIEQDTEEVVKENIPEKTKGAVNKNSEEDEIRIEDIPF